MPESRSSRGKRARRRMLLGCLSLGLALGCTLPAVFASELRRTPIVRAVEGVRPSVVNIHGEKTLRAGEGLSPELENQRRVNGMGTGVIIDEQGFILTNHHVVEGVQKIQVTLADRSTFVARIVSYDAATDLAVIKIDAPSELQVITIGTSSDLMTGEPVIAIGNAYGYQHTVTRGIVSALHRTVQVTETQSYEDLIQTDASINPGNSGGPLLNIDGEMIGINVAVRAGAQGIGFAIPVDKAMAVAADLLSTRRVNNAWHGIVGHPTFAADSCGLLVDNILKNSPAQKSELKPGDVILHVDAMPVTRPLDLERAMLRRRVGERIELVVQRNKRSVNLEIELASLPADFKPASDPHWELLGLKLEPIPAKAFQQYQTRYRGGLVIKAVRPGGPAANQGIRPGDVLVGMHVWETVSLDNVSYVLNRSDFAEIAPIKFYILRGNETLFGHLQVSARDIRARSER